MTEIYITSIYDNADILQINPLPYHDMWVNTVYAHRDDMDNFQLGEFARIYSGAGSMLFAKLYENLAKVVVAEKSLNKTTPIAGPEPSLNTMEKIELIDYIADKSIFAIYKDEIGHIGIQTKRVRFDETSPEDTGGLNGPVVWVSGPLNEKSSPAMRKRAKLFSTTFELTKELAPRFNQPKPEKYNY